MTQPASKQDLKACIDECIACHAICLETVAYCLRQGGRHAAAEHVGLLLDCAQVCQTSADYMIRGSALHVETCAVCADVCEHCAESCERFGNDEAMLRCARTCRECAASCREMAGDTRVEHAA